MDKQRFDLARIWLEHASFFESDRNRTMAMCRYVDRGYLAGVKFLVENGVRPDQNCPSDGRRAGADQTALGKAIWHTEVPGISAVQKKRHEDVVSYLRQAIQSSNGIQSNDDNVQMNDGDDGDAEFLLEMLRKLPRVEANWLFERIRDNDDIADLAERYREPEMFSDEEIDDQAEA